jgi:hypothetical protein
VKATVEVAVPPGVVTVIMPVLVPEATVAVICVALLTVKLDAAFPAKATAVAPVKLVPVIATDVPELPETGVKLAILGTGVVFCGEEEELLAPHASRKAESPTQTSELATRQVETVNLLREAGTCRTGFKRPRAHHATESMHHCFICGPGSASALWYYDRRP